MEDKIENLLREIEGKRSNLISSTNDSIIESPQNASPMKAGDSSYPTSPAFEAKEFSFSPRNEAKKLLNLHSVQPETPKKVGKVRSKAEWDLIVIGAAVVAILLLRLITLLFF